MALAFTYWQPIENRWPLRETDEKGTWVMCTQISLAWYEDPFFLG